MAEIILNTIPFNNVNAVTFGKNGTFVRQQNFANVGDGKQPVKPFVNAVEIDWNGAVRYLPL